MKILVHSLIVLMAIVLAGCNGLPFTNPSTTTSSPQQISGTPVPTSEKGKATVIGRAISSVTGKPYVDEFIRLAEVFYDEGTPYFILDDAFSPGTLSVQDGKFTLTNVPPGEYVITVGEFFTTWKAYKENGEARVYKLEPDQVLDVGIIKVDYER